jgi:hypothetical protein
MQLAMYITIFYTHQKLYDFPMFFFSYMIPSKNTLYWTLYANEIYLEGASEYRWIIMTNIIAFQLCNYCIELQTSIIFGI